MSRPLSILAAATVSLAIPLLASAQALTGSTAPAAQAPVVWSPGATVLQPADSSVRSAAPTALVAARPAALVARTAAEPAKAPRIPREPSRTNTALMVVGLATILIGTAVDDDAGTILILSGAAIGLTGLYRLLQ